MRMGGMGRWEGVGVCVICSLVGRLISVENGLYVEWWGGFDKNAMNKPTQ